MKKLLVILTAAGALFMGCTKSKSQANTIKQMVGEWKIESYSEAKTDDLYGASMSIVEEDDSFIIGGYSGVNYFSQTISKKDNVKLGENMGCTRKMGAPEENDFEAAFLNTLMKSDSWKVEDGKLVITAGEEKIVFVPAPKEME